jgi:threonyl-tRNA synthetase
MRLLLIHADRIHYRATRKTAIAEHIDRREDEMTDCLVVFSCVEKMDEINAEKVVEHGKKEIIDVMQRVKTNKVMIFPFAHLAPSLSSPPVAMNILVRLENLLKDASLEVKRAPFGWYKEWEIKDKGHPLSELSKIVCPYDMNDCDFKCPYCESPIKLIKPSDDKAKK